MRRDSWNVKALTIGSRRVEPGDALYVVAEIGLNHGGSLERALAMVDAAASAGASAVKVQVVSAAELISSDCPAPAHVMASSLRDFFARFELPEAAYQALAARARRLGLGFLATPLSLPAVGLMERVGVDAFKIASGDINWRELIQRCARTGKPMLISTGMATLDETARALDAARSGGAASVALLHCVAAYPVPDGSENLRAIATLQRTFHVPVGLSDHGRDAFAVTMAVALGATLYERHLMLADDEGAVDAAVSSTPDQLAAIVQMAARASRALGDGKKVCLPAESPNLDASRRSWCAAGPMRAGHVVRERDLIALRSPGGVPLHRKLKLVGRQLTRDVAQGAPFVEADLAPAAAPGMDQGVA
jgi:sialic acid synthase SpsE